MKRYDANFFQMPYYHFAIIMDFQKRLSLIGGLVRGVVGVWWLSVIDRFPCDVDAMVTIK
jgi:hypothetical protein